MEDYKVALNKKYFFEVGGKTKISTLVDVIEKDSIKYYVFKNPDYYLIPISSSITRVYED